MRNVTDFERGYAKGLYEGKNKITFIAKQIDKHRTTVNRLI